MDSNFIISKFVNVDNSYIFLIEIDLSLSKLKAFDRFFVDF